MLSSVQPLPQWNPAESLNIESVRTGGLYCAGTKGSGGPCRWVLKEEVLLRCINEIATLSRNDAIIRLQNLADHALCVHHSDQKWKIVGRWTETINELWHVLPASSIVELYGSPPNGYAVTAVKPTLSPSSPCIGNTLQRLNDSRCDPSSSLDFWDKRLQELEDKVELMQKRALPLKDHPRKSSLKIWAKFTRFWMRIISSAHTLV
ncbi:hypothetical protein DE146DRAFT_647955 [Phaeosphaeria sp. MPI-PUGE-AT-0046c]|nr:hypothetical protein DE146DRAFT_647955 [Phaeosphaeria sp. MPI-PUGE-AT-0046c]